MTTAFEALREFVKKLAGQLATEGDLSDIEVYIKPTEDQQGHTATIRFEFSVRRTGHEDEGAGGFIRGYWEPGYFRRRRIMKFLEKTARYELPRHKFADLSQSYGVIFERTERSCSDALQSKWFYGNIYFHLPADFDPMFLTQDKWTAKELGITFPDATLAWW